MQAQVAVNPEVKIEMPYDARDAAKVALFNYSTRITELLQCKDVKEFEVLLSKTDTDAGFYLGQFLPLYVAMYNLLPAGHVTEFLKLRDETLSLLNQLAIGVVCF
ncbi:MAG: hypothetical protein V4490_03805 [Pseudomonadota bacterium]